MNIAQLKGLIAAAAPTCCEPGCSELFCNWPDADETEDKVMYSAREATMAGMCNLGHINEFFVAELKAGEVIGHTVTERTIGRKIAQKDCKHPDSRVMQVPDGMEIPTMEGMVTGPVDIAMCGYCGGRRKVQKVKKIIRPGGEGGRIIIP